MPAANLSYNCPCGGRYKTASRSTHFKTQIHRRWEFIDNDNNENGLSEEQNELYKRTLERLKKDEKRV